MAEHLRPGDTVLVKASRGVGLEVVAQQLAATWQPPADTADDDPATDPMGPAA